MATFTEDIYVKGVFRADTFVLPNNAVRDENVTAAAPLGATKTVHQYVQVHRQAHANAVASVREVVHVAIGAGTLVQAQAGITVAAVGAATVVVDVFKNGTSVLSATITIDNGTVVNDSVIGPIATGPYLANDVFSVSVTATAGGGTLPKGLFVAVTFREAAE